MGLDWLLGDVAVDELAGALEVVVEWDEAAFATAAPPPTSAPVTASVVRRGLIL